MRILLIFSFLYHPLALTADLGCNEVAIENSSNPAEPTNHQEENDELEFELEFEDEFIAPEAFSGLATPHRRYGLRNLKDYISPVLEGDFRPPQA